MDQVFAHYTIDGYRGSTSGSTVYAPWCPLDQFRRNIAKCSSEIAKEEITKLEQALQQKEEEISSLHSKLGISKVCKINWK